MYADGIGPWMPHVREETGVRGSKNTRLVGFAHEAGLLVHVFTLRKDPLPGYASTFNEALSQVKASNVDGLFTDFPDLAVDYFDRKTKSKEE